MKSTILALLLVALVAAPALAQRGHVRGTTRTNVSGHRNTHVNTRTNDVNVRRDTNVNIRRDVDVDVDVNHRYYGGGYYYHSGPSVGAVVAASVATAIVVGTIVYTLPPSCTTIVANGVAYQNCGGVYYQPRYQGSSVTYVVVNHP